MKKVTSSWQQKASDTEQLLNIEQQTKTDSTANTSASDKRQFKLKEESTTEQTSDEEVVTTIKEYDTSQPTDATTGTPPLKKETTQRRRKADTGKQKQTAEQTTDHQQQTAGQTTKEQATNTALQAQQQQHSDADIQVKTDEKRGLNTFQQILCGLGLLVIVGALIWLGWKLKRRF
ncbi:MAG: hypothetical protein RR298_06850 [Alistipes sp.]